VTDVGVERNGTTWDPTTGYSTEIAVSPAPTGRLFAFARQDDLGQDVLYRAE